MKRFLLKRAPDSQRRLLQLHGQLLQRGRQVPSLVRKQGKPQAAGVGFPAAQRQQRLSSLLVAPPVALKGTLQGVRVI